MNREKPKILFVMHLPPPVHGAAIVGEAIRRSEAINSRFDCRFFNLATARNMADIGRFRLSKIRDVFKRRRDICHVADEFRPDLVYLTPCASGMPFYKDYLIARALKKRGYKVLYHFHNKGVARRSDLWPDKRLYRSFFRNAKVMLLSDRLYTDVEKYVSKSDLLVCHNGIEFPPYSKQGNRGSIPRLLFLSNLFKEKGILTLLDTAGILKKKGLSFRLDIAGAPTEEISAEAIHDEISHRGLEPETSYLGPVYGDDKLNLYRKSDIFVFPTRYHNECFPLVLLEAMSQSLTCVSTTEGGIPDIISDGETGYLVESDSPEALAGRLESLITDPELMRNMGRAGHDRFVSLFTLSKFESSFIKALESCV